jgi:putative chitinase
MNKAFFDKLRSGIMGPTLDDDEVTGTTAILEAMAGLPIAWTAYALATAFHETAHTMQPIKEFGGPKYFHRMYDPEGQRPSLAKRNGNIYPGDGVKYCGRGYVQLTWRANYERAGKKLNIDLLNGPDLAMSKDIAALILRHGMRDGWFTGKSFQSYLPAAGPANAAQFQAARRIINGTDKAAAIAGYAMAFQSALQAGGWPT